MCHRFVSFVDESFDILSFLLLLIGDEILLIWEFLQLLIVFLLQDVILEVGVVLQMDFGL